MSAIIPPVLPVWASDLIMALITIGYGMYWERYYTPWVSVILTLVLTSLFLGSNALPIFVIVVLLGYLLIGVLVAVFSISFLKDLFGTKAFGALTLTASLSEVGFVKWFSGVFSYVNAFFSFANVFLLFWLGIGVIAYVMSWYYFGRKTDKDKKWKKKKR